MLGLEYPSPTDVAHGVEHAIEHGMPAENVHAVKAAELLRTSLGPGDLVLLRSRRDGHFARIYFAIEGSVRCHKEECPLHLICDYCPQLGFVPHSEVAAATSVLRVH